MATTIADDLKPLHHPKTWVGKYIWSQDHKVIAIQYSLVAREERCSPRKSVGFGRSQVFEFAR
ncbi:MAG: hypothetical protein Q8R02_02445 [Hyphomonadaceae bacterium]|nr:hypothetical protein [Hyphomonadaceae bacterium]